MIRVCGASLGLFAFTTALVLGLFAGNPDEVVLVRAMQALMVFCGLGMAVGWVAAQVLDEHAVRRHGEMFQEVDEPLQPTGSDQLNGAGLADSQGMDPALAGMIGAANAVSAANASATASAGGQAVRPRKSSAA